CISAAHGTVTAGQDGTAIVAGRAAGIGNCSGAGGTGTVATHGAGTIVCSAGAAQWGAGRDSEAKPHGRSSQHFTAHAFCSAFTITPGVTRYTKTSLSCRGVSV